MGSSTRPTNSMRRRGAVGIVLEPEGLLVIRRSALVRAPNMVCFPGGTIEPGEAPAEAVVRELKEELGLAVTVSEHLWNSVTAWGTELEWFLVDRVPECDVFPDPREVAEVFWSHPDKLLVRQDLLGSVYDFFRAIRNREIQLRSLQDEANWGHLIS